MTGAAYIRVSTDEQAEFSPDSQRRHLMDYAGAHHIFLPGELIFQDDGYSGKDASRRPAFQKMIRLSRLTPPPFQIVLVWKFSRFARNRQDSIFYKSLLKKRGIRVVSITEPTGSEPASLLMEAMLEAMDEYYSLNLGQEVRRGMYEKFSRGGVVSPPPIGYRMAHGRFEPDPRTAPIVRKAFQLCLQGFSCSEIARRLNQLGFRTARRCPFHARSVRYLLQNPVYLGKLRLRSGSGTELVPACHPPLLSESDFAEVQKRLALPSPRRFPTFPFYGILRCGVCHSSVIRVRNSLQCCGYLHGKCRSQAIPLTKLTWLIRQQFLKDFPLCSFPAGSPVRPSEQVWEEILSPEHPVLRQNREMKELFEVVFWSRSQGLSILYRENHVSFLTD